MSADPLLDQYLAIAGRVMELTGDADGAQLATPVPGSPAWTAQQVVAHLAGLCEDWVDGNFDGYATDEWTQAQVGRFEGHTIGDIHARWKTALAAFEQLTESPLGQTPGRWAFGDALSHEADLRPVVAPGTRPPDEAVAAGLKTAISRWRVALAEADAPTLQIIEPVRDWAVGAAATDEAPAATVEVDRYELFRALFGRRSLDQVEQWKWSEDPAPWLSAGLSFPFSWSEADLVD